MILHIVNLVLLLIYILSALNCLRHLFFFINITMYNSNKPPVGEDEEEFPDKKYILDKKSLLFLGLSLSYLISGVIIGVLI